jgi:hypothetical protein
MTESINLTNAIEAHHANVAAGREAQKAKAVRDLAILDLLAAHMVETGQENKEVRAQLIAAEVLESKANHMANDAAKLTRKFPEAVTANDFMLARLDADLLTVTSVRNLEAKPKTAVQLGKAAAVIMLKAIKAVKALTPAAFKAYEKHLVKLLREEELKAQTLAENEATLQEIDAKMEMLKAEKKALKAA